MRSSLVVLLATAGASSLLPTAAFATPADTQQVTSGAVTATLSWKGSKEQYDGVVSPRLKIERDGMVALDAGITDACNGCFFTGDDEDPDMEIADLDGDGELEVVVQGYSGGAHCCTTLGVWDYRAGLGTYGHLTRQLGNSGAVLRDVDRDGKVDILSADDRFAYTFAPYVFSARPTQILAFRRSPKVGLRDVTRSFRSLTRKEAAFYRRGLRSDLRKTTAEEIDLRGPLAAYVADMYLLGRGGEGRKEIGRVRRAGRLGSAQDKVWPGGRRFEPALLRFLKRTGYRR